jgi:hypothetical protein
MTMTSYRLECWRLGLLGQTEAHPLRRIQALIRHRAADADAIARWLILCDIKADLAADDDDTGACVPVNTTEDIHP